MLSIIILVILLVSIFAPFIIFEIMKIKMDKDSDKASEYLRDIQKLVVDKGGNLDIINFYPNRKNFDSKSKNGRKILVVSTIFLLITIPLWIYGARGEIFLLRMGMLSFVLAFIGFLYWASKYHDKRENVHNEFLFYDKLKNVVFYNTSILSYPGCIERSGTFTDDIMREVKFGQLDTKQIVYAIKNITDVKVKDVEIQISGDIVMTSFNKIFNDTSYFDKIEINKRTMFYKNSEEISMYSREIESINIPRAYDDFEEFLKEKGFSI